MLYMSPNAVRVVSWLGSVFLTSDGQWSGTTNGLYFDGGEEFYPEHGFPGNHGFSRHLSVTVGRNGWSAS